MAHFARIDSDGTVVEVLRMSDSKPGEGYYWLVEKFGGTWIKTSYNTQAGVHLLGGTPLRKNYAGIGYTYDEERDAFIPPKDYPSWVLNEDTCQWEAPVPKPTGTDIGYIWDEDAGDWAEVPAESE